MASGCGSKTGNVSFEQTVTPAPLTASASDTIFMYNPDRGYRTHNIIRVHELTQYAGDYSTLMGKVAGEFSIYFQNLKEPCYLSYCYIYFTPWVREKLPEEALTVVKAIFDYARTRKIKLLVSFAYNDQYHEAWYSSETFAISSFKVSEEYQAS